MQAGDTVEYNAGDSRGFIEAKVTRFNKDDGSVDILYPHPADASVMATAERVPYGVAAFHFRPQGEATTAPEAQPLAAALDEIDRLKVALAAAEGRALEAERQIAGKAEGLVVAAEDEAQKALASIASFVERFGIHPDAAVVASAEAPQRITTTPAKTDDDKGKK